MTASITTRSIVARCPCWRGAIGVFAIAMMALGSFDSQPAHGQQRGIVQFPARPKPPATPPGQGILGATKTNTTDQMLLRAERSAKGDGRVYRLTFTGSDGRGGSCSAVQKVVVPLNQGKGSAVDSGLIVSSR